MTHHNAEPELHDSSKSRGRLVRVLRAVLPLLIVLLGAAGAARLYATRPHPAKQIPDPIHALVDVLTVNPGSYPVNIKAMGVVTPSRAVIIKARVSGNVLSVHPAFIEGGRLREGEELLKIDPLDYELALAAARGRLARVEFEANLESGRQTVARREWELLAREDATQTERELALRMPHLKRIKADLEAAHADLRRAEVNIERTSVRVPFDALILTRHVELGSLVREQEPLATVVDTAQYRVKVAVPVDRLPWLKIPSSNGETGSLAVVTTEENTAEAHRYNGRVLRLQGDLDPVGRMARVLVAIDHPLGDGDTPTNRPPLLLGSYVRVALRGRELHNVYRIPRAALREHRTVWVAAQDDTLAIRPVATIWRSEEMVLVKDGLQPGNRVIVTDLTMPISGLPLSYITDEPNP